MAGPFSSAPHTEGVLGPVLFLPKHRPSPDGPGPSRGPQPPAWPPCHRFSPEPDPGARQTPASACPSPAYMPPGSFHNWGIDSLAPYPRTPISLFTTCRMLGEHSHTCVHTYNLFTSASHVVTLGVCFPSGVSHLVPDPDAVRSPLQHPASGPTFPLKLFSDIGASVPSPRDGCAPIAMPPSSTASSLRPSLPTTLHPVHSLLSQLCHSPGLVTHVG